ncbi:tyrosine-type recombinase/integrase [uncultured Hoeflea sp.]|mgnify:CR=1 FL=1|uniref:tyrosine-type recombinase/integrase n=1 Tax=uncultured Hoeflea sp. TaxID=538666 RepID=UPI0030EF1715|tara:strand:- start:153707 stop:155098 length:1392 start_codon:yes stop_codon:yes gene_type:complete
MAYVMMKYVQKRGKQGWRYRRKVPEGLRTVLGKIEIVVPLGKSQAEMMRRYPQVHARAEALLSSATAQAGRTPARQQTAASERELFEATKGFLRNKGFDPTFDMVVDLDDPKSVAEWAARSYAADRLVDEYDIDPETGDPSGISHIDYLRIRALNEGLPTPPAPTFADAVKLYRKEQIGANTKRQMQLDRILDLFKAAISLDTPLTKISRSDARQVRDEMLDHVSSSSVERYLNTVRAVINFGLNEYDLRGLSNPFQGVNPKKDIKTEADTDRDRKRPFPPEDLKATRERILNHASADLRLIWRILEGTGCRLSEVTGLQVADVYLGHQFPYLDLAFRPNRRLKNNASIRRVPLVGDALEATQEAVEVAAGTEFLFAGYALNNGGSRASAALGKHVRACVADSKITTHSLRHTMKERLVAAGVDSAIQDAILGQSSGAVSLGYGSVLSRLEAGHRALIATLPG